MPKFDVVVGNPPYQRNGANPGNPLWPIFSRLGVNSLKENGYICYITPSTWLNGKGIYKDILTKYNTLYINVNECKKYFNTGNNNTYSYWIVQKNKYKNLTLLISKNYITNETIEAKLNLNEYVSLPCGWISYTNELLSIHRKISSYEKMNILSGPTISFKDKRFSTKYDKSHPYRVIYSKRRIIWSSSPEFLQNKLKLLFWHTSNNTRYFNYDDVITLDAIGRQVSCILIDNNLNAKIIKDILSTKFYTFLDKIYRWGAWFGGVNNFPAIDFSHPWTDDEIYKHFNLTKEEIKFIETNIPEYHYDKS